MLVVTFFFCIFIALLNSSEALYSSADDVVQLKSDNFEQFVSGPELCIVKFYASWCGHCEEIAPKFKKAASILKGIVKFGVVDNEAESAIGDKFGISSYPTILIFNNAIGKKEPVAYSGARDIQSIVSFLLEEVQQMAKNRASKEGIKLDIKSSSSKESAGGTCGGNYGSEDSRGSKQEKQRQTDKSGGNDSDGVVITLTDTNFGELVLQSTDEWLVEFFAPWCGHCKNLEPEWKKAAQQLKGHMKLGAVDATVYQSLAQRYSIQGFPTIKYFRAGVKTGSAEDYDGGRNSESIVSWAMAKLAHNKPPPEIVELTNDERLHEACDGQQLCVIAFLPHLLDCQSKCRKDYLKIMTEIGEKYKNNQWGWLWSTARSHKNLEDALAIGGFGYPALVVVNTRKERCAVMRGSFSFKGVNEFLLEVSTARPSGYLTPISSLPKLESVIAWDGKDAPEIKEEEIDLDELETKTEL